ncbi:MAG TPA: hypothetical protein VHB21_27780 [Minicystis sp.]|nr:hypothetical protein [Minicystis sp.]
MSTPEVSGKAFLGIVRYVKDARGDEALRALVERAPGPTRDVFRRQIRATDWHPYDAYAALLRLLERELGGGDKGFSRALGAAAGKRDLGSIFRVYTVLASAERLIRACDKVWPSYYRNAGEMRAVSWSPEDTRLRISGFSGMDPAHCRLMEGWMISTMAMIGFRVSDDARETACASRGAAFHEFACSWTKIR